MWADWNHKQWWYTWIRSKWNVRSFGRQNGLSKWFVNSMQNRATWGGRRIFYGAFHVCTCHRDWRSAKRESGEMIYSISALLLVWIYTGKNLQLFKRPMLSMDHNCDFNSTCKPAIHIISNEPVKNHLCWIEHNERNYWRGYSDLLAGFSESKLSMGLWVCSHMPAMFLLCDFFGPCRDRLSTNQHLSKLLKVLNTFIRRKYAPYFFWIQVGTLPTCKKHPKLVFFGIPSKGLFPS